MTAHDFKAKSEATFSQMASRTFWLVGNKLTVLASHRDTDGRYDLIEGHTPAGRLTPLHRHTRYTEQLYVVDGELTIWTAKRKVVLKAGESFTIPAGTEHVVGATSSNPTHGLVIASPSGFARLIEAAGTPGTGTTAPQPSPADLERFSSAAAEAGDEILGPPGTLPQS